MTVTFDPKEYAGRIRATLAALAEPEQAAGMAAYMKNKFNFFGVPTPLRRSSLRDVLAEAGRAPDADWLLAVACVLWSFTERECQYVACDLLVKNAKRFGVSHEPELARFVQEKSWWDTVDMLACRVYGPLLAAHPQLLERVFVYASHEDMWLRRVAILYPMHYGVDADTVRLAAILDLNLDHPDFFIRKAMGWILRQQAKSRPEWVRAYLDARGSSVPALTRREACKHLLDCAE